MAQAALRFGETFDRVGAGMAGGATRSSVSTRPWSEVLEALLVSTGIVALAEIGDKTQLLSLVLAARYRRPAPIIVGILAATLANHALAAALGTWITTALSANALRWILGASFLTMAVWMLVPDRLDDSGVALRRFGVFGATLVAFFLVEMGDKTQIATVALAARYAAFAPVVAGTTLGMMIANVPVVLLGHRVLAVVPIGYVRVAAAVVFAAFGMLALLGPALVAP